MAPLAPPLTRQSTKNVTGVDVWEGACVRGAGGIQKEKTRVFILPNMCFGYLAVFESFWIFLVPLGIDILGRLGWEVL